MPELDSVREGPLVSIVVRTKDRPALLAEALASIAASTYRRLEVVLVNDGGASPSCRRTASRCRWCASTSTPTAAGRRRPTPASRRRAAITSSSSTTTI